MKKVFTSFAAIAFAALFFTSCQKKVQDQTTEDLVTSALDQNEKFMIKAAGFNSNWAEKTVDGNFLIEGDILLTKSQLQQMAGVSPTNNFIIAREEHYRTTQIVNAPSGSKRIITVSLGGGFPAHYSTGLNQALDRYNSLDLSIQFQRVNSGGEIHISGANLGRSFGGGCILGQAAGFPTNGNPSSGFTLSTNKCATSYLSTANKADEVIAHEIGHCIGFRHTDYMNRAFSCGSGGNEGDSGVGAIHIDGTPTVAEKGSWMLACTDNSPLLTANDNLALRTVYPK